MTALVRSRRFRLECYHRLASSSACLSVLSPYRPGMLCYRCESDEWDRRTQGGRCAGQTGVPSMSEISAKRSYISHYDDYYATEDSRWRWIGADGKAKNVMALCGALDCGSILDIGAGEGSLLQRLSEGGLGREWHAIEISSSGLEALRKRNIPRLVDARI